MANKRFRANLHYQDDKTTHPWLTVVSQRR